MPHALGIYGDNDYISSHFSFDVSSPELNIIIQEIFHML